MRAEISFSDEALPSYPLRDAPTFAGAYQVHGIVSGLW